MLTCMVVLLCYTLLVDMTHHNVQSLGARFGRRATWIGASGDQTFMRIDESLINALTLQRSNIFASQNCIGMFIFTISCHF